MAEGDDQTKEFEPSQRKIDEARRRGDTPKSVDLSAAAALGGLVLALQIFGTGTVDGLGGVLKNMLSEAVVLPGESFDHAELSAKWLRRVASPVLPIFFIPAVLVFAVLIVSRGIAVSGEKLIPKSDRINPIKNAAQKFGPNGLMEFMKSLVKLAVVSIILFLFFRGRLDDLIGTIQVSERLGLLTMSQLLLTFLFIATLLGFGIGLLDLVWQRYRHNAKLRMSRQEMREELRQNEGDPHLKGRRRQKGYDIATNRMLQEVPKADVVVVNPQHYAVALKWEENSGRAPICIAKGVNEIAARIREIANSANVPIHRDPPTARALYAAVDVGSEIQPQHYRTVAAAIRFATQIRKRDRSR